MEPLSFHFLLTTNAVEIRHLPQPMMCRTLSRAIAWCVKHCPHDDGVLTCSTPIQNLTVELTLTSNKNDQEKEHVYDTFFAIDLLQTKEFLY